jgi:predicted RNA-binding Zn-ribbon protein involved in translation (DUF1610 family)
MKFLCVSCDAQMTSVDQAAPEDGTLAIVFRCPRCRREVAMLANPMETQMVKGLCVEVGGRSTARRPLQGVRAHLEDDDAEEPEPRDSGGPSTLPGWSEEAEARLGRIPGFVRGMVRQLYVDWARDHGVAEITNEVMDRARGELGLDEMG